MIIKSKTHKQILNIMKKLTLLITILILSNCAAHNQKLAKKLDKLSNGGDTSKVISYLDKLDKDKITDDDGSLIRKTIELNNSEVINKLLLQENIKINIKGEDGLTSLGYLIVNSDNNDETNQIAEALINNGADVNAINNINEPLILLSTENKKDEITKLLIDNGADINAKSNLGETAIHFAEGETLKILVENNADINIKDNKGNSVIHKLYFIDDIKYMISLGLDINEQNNQGETVLFNACTKTNCNDARIEKLIAIGADPDIKNSEELSIAHLALKTKSYNTLKILVANDADTISPDKSGKTPLHYLAISLNDVNFSDDGDVQKIYESAALLFSSGSDPLSEDNDGKNPYQIASETIKEKIKIFQTQMNGSRE
jgi:ankyrin repeat protein